MGNILSLLNLKNKPSRNGFDLSEKVAFTAKVGELLPVVTKEILPGDKFNISNQWFTRTRPVNTAAYTRMREYYDWFFIPNRLLWKNFLPFVTNQVENGLIAKSIKETTTVPDEHPYFTFRQVAEYIYRVSTDNAKGKNIFGFNRGQLTAKLMNMLGYGWYQEYVTRNWRTSTGQGYEAVNLKLNPFPLLAYQKVYQDFYREQQWQKSEPYTYNLEYVNSSNLNIPTQDIMLENTTMFDLQYCNWNKDLFMGVLPRTQYGVESVVPLMGNSNASLRFSGKNDTVVDAGAVQLFKTGDSKANYLGKSDGTALFISDQTQLSTLSILALRQYEFLQKYKEIAQSGQQDYKHQIEKHFGVNVPDAMSEHVTYLGGYSSNLDISEVVNTNITGDNVSDIAGKGAGVGRGNIDYEFKEHGILMCVYHCVPLLDFETKGVDKFNMKTMFTDYAIPELDCVGMQSVQMVELINTPELVQKLAESNVSLAEGTYSKLGYVPRYVDYKTSYDKVRGGFMLTDLQGWTAPVNSSDLVDYFAQTASVYKNYSIDSSFFKVNPSVLDRIFGVNADSALGTDQLLVNSSFDIKAVRNLDRNGLPY